mgnify:CR=1 FL=1
MDSVVFNGVTADVNPVIAAPGAGLSIAVWGLITSVDTGSDVTQFKDTDASGTSRLLVRCTTQTTEIGGPVTQPSGDPLFRCAVNTALYMDKSTSNAQYGTLFYTIEGNGPER